MGATSSTGTGPGESHGLYKPENTSGCCCNQKPVDEPKKPPKTHCVTRITTGFVIRYKTGGNSSIRVCGN